MASLTLKAQIDRLYTLVSFHNGVCRPSRSYTAILFSCRRTGAVIHRPIVVTRRTAAAYLPVTSWRAAVRRRRCRRSSHPVICVNHFSSWPPSCRSSHSLAVVALAHWGQAGFSHACLVAKQIEQPASRFHTVSPVAEKYSGRRWSAVASQWLPPSRSHNVDQLFSYCLAGGRRVLGTALIRHRERREPSSCCRRWCRCHWRLCMERGRWRHHHLSSKLVFSL